MAGLDEFSGVTARAQNVIRKRSTSTCPYADGRGIGKKSGNQDSLIASHAAMMRQRSRNVTQQDST
jgi:hypothetical protein